MSIDSEVLFEISLYVLLFVLVVVIRWSRTRSEAPKPLVAVRPKPVGMHKKRKRPPRPAIDWRKVERVTEIPEFIREVPPAPPNSPVSEIFEPFIEPPIEEPVLEVLPDMDFERRRNYVKRQITDGEVLIKIETYNVCQIFVNGIEYHYVEKEGVTSWDCPSDIMIDDWFLVMPKHRRKRIPEPPHPLDCHVDTVPHFI
jgi:hypothetical protein